MASKPVDEQGSLLKGSVTIEWLKEPCYPGSRLWESSMVKSLWSQAMPKGSPFWHHPLSRLISCSLNLIPAANAKPWLLPTLLPHLVLKSSLMLGMMFDKFPSDLIIVDGKSEILNTLLEAKDPTREKSIGYGMQKKESRIEMLVSKPQRGILCTYVLSFYFDTFATFY